MSFTPTDIELFQGSYAQFDFHVTDALGNAVDLSSYSIKAGVYDKPGASASLLAAFAVSGVTTGLQSLTAGDFRLYIASSAATALPDPVDVPARPYYLGFWDVFIAPSAATATNDQQYAAGHAYIYPRGTRR